MSKEWVCLSVITFRDDTASVRVLAQGTKEECDRMARLIDAVSYSGPKAVDRSYFVVMPEQEWRDALEADKAASA